ncbi:alginate lyase family protein [Streptantibioticus ferralitis]|uniref:Alginate lyase family protein n=1 Tax=Streptantibioticus ferralitis TaxID=236510 RepID=A0ABT5Z5S6_9ACTN|nr:alginate lyase family protein [Streptantibioticus ferralitis]MDF2259178.1 alginate lyase family protein [Streptantibioticus ferralitis]
MKGRPRRRRGALLAAAAVLAAVLVPTAPAAGATPHSHPHSAPAPGTVVLDGAALQQARRRIDHGDPVLRRELADLTARADGWLGQGPWTVTSKPQTPPGGDRHDYLSEAPYFWPTQPKSASNPWGCPYVQEDGQRYPGVDAIPDHGNRGRMFDAVYTLTLAWYYTGRAAYAQHAARILRTWFVDPATRMNPNLDHAQFVPCQSDGRAIGVIDFSQEFTSVLDATAVLDTGAPGWSRADRGGMLGWDKAFLRWLRTSPFGPQEAAERNNHGSFYDMQLAALALATGDTALARDTVRAAETQRLDMQIAADGSQPLELARTRSWHYSTFNLVALTRLAAIGRHVGVNLWGHRTADGASLFRAVDYLLPAATGAAPWGHQELEFHAYAASDIVHAAADAGDPAARAALPTLQPPPGGDDYGLRPAPEQLDPISG